VGAGDGARRATILLAGGMEPLAAPEEKIMLRRVAISLSLVLLSAALSLPAQAAPAEYLFDLTADDILRLMDEYVGPRAYDPAAALERMTAPFDCRHYDELCTELGSEYTYLLLEEVWRQGLRGASPKVIAAEAEVLLPKFASAYLEVRFPDGIDPKDLFFGVPIGVGETLECTQKVVHVDSGAFRLRQTSRKADLVLVFTPFAQSEFFKKNSNGKYRGERADRLRVEGQHFFTTDDIPNVETKVKDRTNDKQVTVVFGGFDIGNAVQDVHVESCGTADDAVFLQACACTGARPEIYEGL
jgi:hypothetical protein